MTEYNLGDVVLFECVEKDPVLDRYQIIRGEGTIISIEKTSDGDIFRIECYRSPYIRAVSACQIRPKDAKIIEGFVNIYPDRVPCKLFGSKEEADESDSKLKQIDAKYPPRTNCVKLSGILK